MKKYLLPNEGNFYKANLHCHSNLSDGILSPKELKDLYRAHGYSVLAYTDHDIFIPHNELTDDSFVALSGFEAQFNGSNKYPGVPNEKKCHMCIIAGTPDIIKQPCWNEEYAYIGNAVKNKYKVQIDEETSPFVREYSPDGISKMIKICRDKGFFITYNHPSWSLENYEQYMNYDGMHALEIFNYSCELLGYHSYASSIYDDILKSGKKIFAVAADDNHNNRRPDSFGGFVMIKAKELKYEAITEALFNGDFYSSTGPEIHELYVEDNKVHVKCSDAVMISLTTDRRFSKCIWQEDGKFITEAVFDLNCECEYFRITVKDINGNHANTNAYFMEDL